MDIDCAVETVCARTDVCERAVLRSVLTLALEIACEGHEGRAVGTLFTIGNAAAVLSRSRALVLDPLAGHGPAYTQVRPSGIYGGTLVVITGLPG